MEGLYDNTQKLLSAGYQSKELAALFTGYQTCFGLLLTPVFFTTLRSLSKSKKPALGPSEPAAAPAE